MIYNDLFYIEGLRNRDPLCLALIYKQFFPIAKSIVERNSGSHQDAEDVFQDSIVVLYNRISVSGFELNCTLRTFFYSVCLNIWKQKLDRKWRLVFHDNIVNEPHEAYEPEIYNFDEQHPEKLRMFHDHFEMLPCDCQQILNLFMAGISLKEIARLVGLKDDNYVKTRKYLCKNMLRRRIMQDPEFSKFSDDDA